MMLRMLKPIYKFVADMIAVDEGDYIAGDYHDQLDVAKLIVQRVGAALDIPWPVGSQQFLVLSAELATCTLVADRQKPDCQPGLPHLLRCLKHEASELPADELPSDDEYRLQQIHLGTIRFAAMELEAYDLLTRSK